VTHLNELLQSTWATKNTAHSAAL